MEVPMKIDRLIGILSILLQKNTVTAPELAERFEVSRRTIGRDIDALCRAGIPIQTRQGTNGGISIMENFRMDRTLLTGEEMRDILAGLRSLDSVNGTNRYGQLMEKLSAGSSNFMTGDQSVLIDLSSWYKDSLAPKIELIRSAFDGCRELQFLYYAPKGESWRIIEPYYLIFRWSSWYVWGWCRLRKDFRLFKLNRMEKLRQENEEIAVKRLEDSKQNLDYMGCMLDICTSAMKKTGTSGAGSASAAGTQAAAGSASAAGAQTAAGTVPAAGTAELQSALADTKTTLSMQGAGSYAGDFGRYITAYQNTAMALSHLISLAALGLTFGNADGQMAEAAETFYENRNLLTERTMREDQYRTVQRKIRQFSGSASKAAVDQFILDNGARLFLDVAAIAEYGAAKTVAGGSALWSASARLVGGEWIDASESFLVGMFGMQYEADAVALARQELDRMLSEQNTALSEAQEKELRNLFFHAAKACLVTRTYGCAGCPAILEKYPQLQTKQNAISEELSSIAARVSNPAVPFGRLPGQLLSAGPYRQEHYKNVLYNFCSLQGQILDWKNERPAKNVRVEVVSKSGEKLAEFVTDKNGRFEAEFALEEINVREQTPLVQELTLHLYYKRNPVVLEDIQADYFHSYEVNGLHVGRKTQESLAYVQGASVQDGQTAVQILRIRLDEDVWSLDAPDGFGGSYPAYVALPGQMHTASDAETVLLEEGVELETVYGRLCPHSDLFLFGYRPFFHRLADHAGYQRYHSGADLSPDSDARLLPKPGHAGGGTGHVLSAERRNRHGDSDRSAFSGARHLSHHQNRFSPLYRHAGEDRYAEYRNRGDDHQ